MLGCHLKCNFNPSVHAQKARLSSFTAFWLRHCWATVTIHSIIPLVSDASLHTYACSLSALHGTKTVALCHSLGKPLRVQMKEHNNNNNNRLYIYIYSRAKSHAKSARNSSSHTCTGQSASICMQIKPPTGADIWCSSAL